MKKIYLAVVGIMTISGFTQAQISNGLTAKYYFNDGNANDEIGNNNGVVNGAILTSDRFGNMDKAYYFDGITNYIDLGVGNDIKPTIGSVSLWFNIDTISTTGSGYTYNPIMLAKNDQPGSSYFEGYCFYIVMADNKLVSVTTESQSTNQKYIFTSNDYPHDSWHHVVMTYDNDSLWLYSNGVLEGAVYKGFNSTFSASTSVLLGASADVQNNRFFNGSIDDIRIYNRILSMAEVNELYNESDPSTSEISENITSNNLVNIYPNPTKNFFCLSQISDVIVIDITGKTVLQKTSTKIVDMSQQPSGIYFVKLLNENGIVMQQNKLIKE